MQKLYVVLFAGVLLAGALVPLSGVAEDKPKKKTLCAWFDPNGGGKYSQCTTDPKDEAQKKCDAKLKEKKIDGSCECTDDESYINGRCG